MWYQQGDVIMRSIVSIPQGKMVVQREDGVLARGEATGHAHRLTEMSDGLLTEVDGQLYLSVGEGGATVRHEEHKAMTLPPGEYKIDTVREYDHFAQMARAVRD